MAEAGFTQTSGILRAATNPLDSTATPKAAVPRGFSPTRLTMVSSIMESSATMSSFVDDSLAPVSSLSPLEVWCLVKLEEWYSDALALKCPWMRRRMLDCVDAVETVARTTLIHKHLDIVGPTMGCRGVEDAPIKQKGLTMEDVASVIRGDWKEKTMKGYYVTGKMNSSIYRDDCFFDGPDPDMPIKGLRKFCGSASQLFDRKKSTAELVDLQVEGNVIVARWKMNGVLRLPFRPKMPEVVGKTTYYLDEDNLIYKHEESWDISAIEAFYKTEWFGNFGNIVYHAH
ncbi:Uncharacterized conserved protein (DUF2358) [Seminavis robusta]|uniref:Uncharacterized conserved protein (DUF2358) n=1 Tax=Seminavis robusta TaxID=568900 RepID=A0A9N8EBY4_9STRA|nr:Uncharacterized conserved protein (DUF2358) [Seminavis robusta]|eukprot:Sro725_g193310.1 Uncharacterized conserved protein (DUF2358) (286) ;mRNA; r:21299-22156